MSPIQVPSNTQFTFLDEVYEYTKNVPRTQISQINNLKIDCLSIKAVLKLTSHEDVNEVYELTLENSNAQLDFDPGDHISILPENDGAEVDLLLKLLNIDKISKLTYIIDILKIENEFVNTDLNVKLVTKPSLLQLPKHIPKVGSLKYIFQHIIDIRRIPSKALLKELCKYTINENEKDLLEKIYKDKSYYLKYILEENISILDLLKKFSSCQPPFTVLLQYLPKISPRLYSICNSPLVNKDEIKICFSIIKFNNGTKGITTGWLEKIIKGHNKNNMDFFIIKYIQNNTQNSAIPLHIKKSLFHLPSSMNTPIIMICNGTGIAPFIGFLQHRQALKKTHFEIELGITWLYYGCRYKSKDFLYKKELQEFLNNDTLSKLCTSHSRESATYKYVQDCVTNDIEEIINIIMSSGSLYLCGSNKMIKNIETLFLESLEKYKKITNLEAKHIVKNLKENKKYITDIWT